MNHSEFEYHSCRNGVELILANGRCQISFIRKDMLHVRYGFGKSFSSTPSFAVLLQNEMPKNDYLDAEKQQVALVTHTVQETGEGLILQTPCLQVQISFAPFTLCVLNADGDILQRDVPGLGYQLDTNQRRNHYFCLDGFDEFYGFGDKGGALNKFHRRLQLYSCDAMGFDALRTDPLYKHIPFFIKRNRQKNLFCGIFYDSPARGILDIGCEKSNYYPSYAYFSADSGDINYYVIAGGNTAEIVQNYTDLTGKTRMPSLPSLGYLASTMYFTELDSNADVAIEDFIQTLLNLGFACDGYHLSSGYTAIGKKRYVFNWDKKRFPQPKDFVQKLRAQGVLLSPNLKPALLLDHPLYDTFAKEGAFLQDADTGKPYVGIFWGGPASFIDFTTPAAHKLWGKYLTRQLIELGVTDFWIDNNEYEIGSHAACSLEDAKLPAQDIKPAFANLMARTTLEAMENADPNHRSFVLTRAGYAGIQRYAQTWTGDNYTSWQTLQYNILQMLSLGLSGVANQGSDIGGFQGPAPDGELFVRWVQNGIFQPRFSIHSCNTDNTITLPWSYPEYTPLVLDAFHLRYALLFYFYSLFHEASTTGAPLMRPLFYEFPNDEACYKESFDFLCGPWLLVANVVEPEATTRQVTLPKGTTWYAWESHKAYEGGQTITVDAPLSKIPLFYRAGAIIPLVEPALHAKAESLAKLRVLLEVSQPGTFTLYQDDGHSNQYRAGVFHKTQICSAQNGDAVQLSFDKTGQFKDAVQQVELEIAGLFKAPLTANLAQQEFTAYLLRQQYEQASGPALYFDVQTRHTWLKYTNPQGSYTVALNYEPKDLVGM